MHHVTKEASLQSVNLKKTLKKLGTLAISF